MLLNLAALALFGWAFVSGRRLLAKGGVEAALFTVLAASLAVPLVVWIGISQSTSVHDLARAHHDPQFADLVGAHPDGYAGDDDDALLMGDDAVQGGWVSEGMGPHGGQPSPLLPELYNAGLLSELEEAVVAPPPPPPPPPPQNHLADDSMLCHDCAGGTSGPCRGHVRVRAPSRGAPAPASRAAPLEGGWAVGP